MAQRSIEVLIGRLVTDESFRAAFVADPSTALTAFAELGYDLTATERAAVKAVASEVWARAAADVDPRLQRASVTSSERTEQ